MRTDGAMRMRAAWRAGAMAAFGCLGALGGVAAAGEPTPVPVRTPTGAEGFAALLEPISATATISPPPAPALDAIERIVDVFRPRIASLRARLQCVPFARAESGVDLRGDASTWWRQAAGRYVRAQEPRAGAVLVLKGYNTDRRGHVAVVRHVISERKIVIDHANWLNQGEITVNVPVEDVSPAGDWSQVRVWHVPGGHWGRRVYTAQGFIEARSPVQASANGGPPLS